MAAKKSEEKKKNTKGDDNPEVSFSGVNADGAGSARIKVIGMGGCGRNAVNRMIDCEISDVTFFAMDTDEDALRQKSKAPNKIYVGKITGGDPVTVLQAAEENLQEIKNSIRETDVLIIVADLGDGVGMGAAILLAKIARELGILTIGLVTLPFSFEGEIRKNYAGQWREYLKDYSDAVVVYPLDNLLGCEDVRKDMYGLLDYCYAFLKDSVQSIKEIVSDTSVINVDFEDLKATLSEQGGIFIGFGRGKGEERVKEAYESAVNNSMLDTSVTGAKRILIRIVGSGNTGLMEYSEIADLIEQDADEEADCLIGMAIDDTRTDEIKVTIIAAGLPNTENRCKKNDR